jgi:hypothetical protein
VLFSATLRKRAQARHDADPGRAAKAGAAPRRFGPVLAPMAEPVATGLLPQTPVATARGWVPVGRLQPGDKVLTFDHGAQPLQDIVTLSPDDAIRPANEKAIAAPTGALENRAPLVLLPAQAILLESDHAEELFGDPFALVPAAALAGWRGIEAVDMPDDPGLALRFDQDQIVYANGATLMFCPGSSGPNRSDLALAPLSISDARKLVTLMIEDEDVDDKEAAATPGAFNKTGR